VEIDYERLAGLLVDRLAPALPSSVSLVSVGRHARSLLVSTNADAERTAVGGSFARTNLPAAYIPQATTYADAGFLVFVRCYAGGRGLAALGRTHLAAALGRRLEPVSARDASSNIGASTPGAGSAEFHSVPAVVVCECPAVVPEAELS
jgi:hypothetical protein